MKTKHIIALFTFIICLFLIPLVSADCTVTLDAESYVEGEIVTVSAICSAPIEKSTSYVMNWTNASGDTLESDTGTTPATINTYFYETYTIPTGYVNSNGSTLNVTLQGTDLEGTDSATIEAVGVTDILISNISITSDYYLNKQGAVSFYVRDNNNEPVSNAQCMVDVINGDNLPICQSGEVVPSQGNGLVLYSIPMEDTIFKESNQYKWDISCTCFNSSESNSFTPGHCYNSSGTSIKTFANGESQYPFNITDVGDKMIINASHNDTHPGIWVENEHGYRVNTTPSLSTVWQEDIDWNDYAEADGQAFLTAGEKFRVCVRANNTFDGDEHITFDHLHLIRKTGSEVFVYRKDGSYLDDNKFLHIEIKSHEETGLTYQKCSDWLLLPTYIKGQNNWKIAFHMQVEGYDQDVELNSDRFTIFGERRDKDYINFLTLNNVSFNYDNVTEGEYVQIQLNITNNHPYRNSDIKMIFQLFSDWNVTAPSARTIDVAPYDTEDYLNPDGLSFTLEGVFPSNFTSFSNSPRFKYLMV